jgi:hypothetical protein
MKMLMDCDINIKANINIIDDILKAIERGECIALQTVAEELRSLRARLVSGTLVSMSNQSASEELSSLLNRNPRFASEVRQVVALTAIRFLEMEIKYYSELALRRDLTEDEK